MKESDSNRQWQLTVLLDHGSNVHMVIEVFRLLLDWVGGLDRTQPSEELQVVLRYAALRLSLLDPEGWSPRLGGGDVGDIVLACFYLNLILVKFWNLLVLKLISTILFTRTLFSLISSARFAMLKNELGCCMVVFVGVCICELLGRKVATLPWLIPLSLFLCIMWHC